MESQCCKDMVVGRREQELEVVRQECSGLKGVETLKFVGDFTSPKDLVSIRTVVERGASSLLASLGLM